MEFAVVQHDRGSRGRPLSSWAPWPYAFGTEASRIEPNRRGGYMWRMPSSTSLPPDSVLLYRRDFGDLFPMYYMVSRLENSTALRATNGDHGRSHPWRRRFSSNQARSRERPRMPVLQDKVHLLFSWPPPRPVHQRKEPKSARWQAWC